MKNKDKGAIIQATLVLFGTFGVIVPLAIMLLPSTGKFTSASPLIPGYGESFVPRPPKSQLSFYIRGLNQLPQMSKVPLHSAQLWRLSSLISPWLQRPTMTDIEAKRLLEKIQAILTPEQQNLMRAWQMSLGSYSPPLLSNDWQGRAIQEFRDTFNPFYPPAKHQLFSVLPPEMQERYHMRYDERMIFLKQWRNKSKGIPKSQAQSAVRKVVVLNPAKR